MTNEYLIEILYRALNSNIKQIVDNAMGGDFKALTFIDVTLIRQIKTRKTLYTRDSKVENNTYVVGILIEQCHI